MNEHRRVKPEVGSRDFDFEFGEWEVQHRTKRADGTWLEFSGTSVTRPTMDGMGNVEENRFHKPGGVTRGLALRTYDAKADLWAIWWVDGRDPHAALDPPVKGRFVEGVGTFYADNIVDGKTIRTRYIWSKITARTARWEQALSMDAGATWDTNWIMEFRRQ
ncbi:hypothetical protein BWI17_19205 [Betaproteobacteria bacterium GR16-43]|nr:hypothetical protein BWI17_19205 [Betaproteobacteria bacterium GR16-43]